MIFLTSKLLKRNGKGGLKNMHGPYGAKKKWLPYFCVTVYQDMLQ